jgi:hypothetical protein
MDPNIAASCRMCFFDVTEGAEQQPAGLFTSRGPNGWLGPTLFIPPLRDLGLSEAIRAAWSATGHSLPTPWVQSGPP